MLIIMWGLGGKLNTWRKERKPLPGKHAYGGAGGGCGNLLETCLGCFLFSQQQFPLWPSNSCGSACFLKIVSLLTNTTSTTRRSDPLRKFIHNNYITMGLPYAALKSHSGRGPEMSTSTESRRYLNNSYTSLFISLATFVHGLHLTLHILSSKSHFLFPKRKLLHFPFL